MGRGHGHLRGAHKTSVPSVRIGVSSVSGHLPPEVIQRIVRQNFGRFRLCYENGPLEPQPGRRRVAVRFVIGADGLVSNVGNGGSLTCPTPAWWAACSARLLRPGRSPSPTARIVTVTYPIAFSPGG